MENRMAEIFAELGRRLETFGTNTSTRDVIQRAAGQNPWFRPEEMVSAARNIARAMLSPDALREWFAAYPSLPVPEPKNVLVIMAGNIPFVGFQDLLCVLMAGHRALLKFSSKDEILMSHVVSELLDISPVLPVSALGDDSPDAVIAMGGDNAVRVFRERYAEKPMLLRGSRSSLAVLDGTETRELLNGLADDILSYSGLGCRNVSLVFVPAGYDFAVLKEALSKRAADVNPKYLNNYRQTGAMLKLEGANFIDMGAYVLVEEREFSKSVSRINYAFYDSSSEVKDWVTEHDEEIQCVASEQSHYTRSVGLGSTQKPTLGDYPDGRDTMEFLARI